MRVLLIGISGVYNYGTEAIVRGTVNYLNAKYGRECSVVYASRNVKDDRRRLEGCEVEIIERPFKKWTFMNVFRKLMTYANIEIEYQNESLSLLEGIDEVYSIGGDIYTLDHNNKCSKSLPLFGEECIKRGIPYVLFGCSVGPFSENKKIERFFTEHLNKISEIVAREQKTVDYLKSISVKTKVRMAPDPAFFVERPVQKNASSVEINRIGINFSPLSALFFEADINDAINDNVKLITHLIDKLDCKISLLPHVIYNDMYNGDNMFMTEIYNRIPEKYKEFINFIQDDPGFLGIKNEIVKCEVVISARMHCAINTITCNVPIIFLTYSSKALGMSKFLYGNTDYAIPMSKIDYNNLIQLISKVKTHDFTSFLDKNNIKNYGK